MPHCNIYIVETGPVQPSLKPKAFETGDLRGHWPKHHTSGGWRVLAVERRVVVEISARSTFALNANIYTLAHCCVWGLNDQYGTMLQLGNCDPACVAVPLSKFCGRSPYQRGTSAQVVAKFLRILFRN
jgi:hypothetical protein